MPFDPNTATRADGKAEFDPTTAEQVKGGDSSEFSKGFKRSFAEVPGLISGLAAYGADVVGATTARDKLLDYTEHRQKAVEENYGSDAASFTNVLDGKADAGDFLGNAAGYASGQALQSVVTGGGGALIAKMAAKKAAAKAAETVLQRELAAGATREVAEKAAAAEAAKVGTKAAWTGATAAGFGQNLTMEGGSIYPEAVEQAHKEGKTDLTGGDLAQVGGAAVTAAITDTAMDRIMAGKVLAGSEGASIIRRLAKEVPKGMAREATTEGIQTGIERLGAGRELMTPEAIRDYVDSMAVGAVGGGLGGAAAGLTERAPNPTPNPSPNATPNPPIGGGTPPVAGGPPTIPAAPAGPATVPAAAQPPANSANSANSVAPPTAAEIAEGLKLGGGAIPINQDVDGQPVMIGLRFNGKTYEPDDAGIQSMYQAAGNLARAKAQGLTPFTDTIEGRALSGMEQQANQDLADMRKFGGSNVKKTAERIPAVVRGIKEAAAAPDAGPLAIAAAAGVDSGAVQQAAIEQATAADTEQMTKVEATQQETAKAAETAQKEADKAEATAKKEAEQKAAAEDKARRTAEADKAKAEDRAAKSSADGEKVAKLHARFVALQSKMRPEEVDGTKKVLDKLLSGKITQAEHDQYEKMAGTMERMLDGRAKKEAAKTASEKPSQPTPVQSKTQSGGEKSSSAPAGDEKRSPADQQFIDSLPPESKEHAALAIQAHAKNPDLTTAALEHPEMGPKAERTIFEAIIHGRTNDRETRALIARFGLPEPAAKRNDTESPEKQGERNAVGSGAETDPNGQHRDKRDSGVDAGAHEAAVSPRNDKPEPTKEQILGGNAELGHVKIAGLDISIENPEGSTRTDLQNDPPQWSTKMKAHYGYIRGTVGKDKDHLDVFIKPGTPEDFAGQVFIIDQKNADGGFDEHKIMLGYAGLPEALKAYKAHYPKDWDGIMGSTGMPMAEFKEWIKGDTTKPITKQAEALPNATAPEHVATGVDDRELGQIVEEFNNYQEGMIEDGHPITRVFETPKKKEIVRLADKAKVYHKENGWMTVAEAKAQIQKWKDHAAAQGEAERNPNAQRVVLSLFDLTGSWSKPWEEAGYQVYRFDIQDDPEVGDVNNFSTEFFNDWFGSFDGMDIYAVLAACPCTDFAVSGARHFAAKDEDGRTVASVKLVHQTLATIEYFKPAVWAIENPVGRIEKLGNLPPWRLSFDPNHLGDPYTKKTLLWGRFNADLPIAPVEPTEGSKMHKLYGGKSLATKNARSETPEGFSYGFFMANNAIDHPVMAIANKFDRLDRKAIEAAVARGVTEAQITSAVEDFYYFDLDDEAANAAIRELEPEPDPDAAVDDEGQQDELPAEMRAYEAKAEAANKAATPQDPSDTLKRLGFSKTGPGPGEWVRAVSKLGDVIAKPIGGDRFEVSADYMGRRFATATVSGEAELTAKVDQYAAKINEGREKLAREAIAEERGMPDAPTAAALPAAKSPEQLRAEADLMAGLADLADIFGKNAKLNMLPEQQQKIGPVLTRVFDAAFRLGYIKFKQAAKFVLDTIRTRIGADVADQITIDDLQGAYIGMAQNYKDKGADSKRDVIDVETLAELETTQNQAQNGATEAPQNGQTNQPAVGAPDTPAGSSAGRGRGTPAQQPDAGNDSGNLEAGQPGNVGASGTGEPGAGTGQGAAGPDVGAQGGTDAGRAPRNRRTRAGRGRNPDAGTGGNGGGSTAGAGSAASDVAPTSPAAPPQGDFVIADPLKIAGGGQVARFEKNKAAIELRNRLVDEGRHPTPEEQAVLAGYTGWGSFGQELFKGTWDKPAPKAGWEARDQWLRDNLGETEWEGLQRSIINAHYTDPPTVMAMWDMVKRMGFTGGRVLEPSIGIGNFYGMMPVDLTARSQRAGIELDPVTGSMAQMLYPNANIQIKGYEQSTTPDNFYDLVIGNWPFSEISPADRRYNRMGPTLHDYFFLKAIDQTKPGGLIVGITTKGTMDKKGITARMEMARKAELVAAFRLPSGAFEEYAGTAVVTDIIILRKREKPVGMVDKDGWIDVLDHDTKEGTKVPVNEYFHRNPSHVIGEIDFGHGTTTFRPGLIVHRPPDMMGQLRRIVDLVPEGAFKAAAPTKHISFVANHTSDRTNALVKNDKGLFIVQGEYLAPANEMLKYELKDAKKTAVRVGQLEALIDMRKLYGRLIDAERAGNAEKQRKELRDAYEAFTKEHGPLSKSFGLSYLEKIDDPFYPSLASLEIRTGEDTFRPAGILSASTMRGAKSIENPTVTDAFVLARNESVNPSVDRIAELAKTTPAEVRKQLIDAGAAFELPNGDFAPSDIYLSGNVRAKMREARAALEAGNEAMQRNVDALAKVIPADVPYYKIETQMGATWVPASAYADYIAHMLGLDSATGIDVEFQGGAWKINFDGSLQGRPQASSGYGSPHVRFKRLVRAAIANQTINVKYKDSDGVEHVDDEATKEVNGKIAEMRLKFGEWLWKDPVRRVALESEYNEVRNAYATPHFDGSFLGFQGMALSLGRGPFNLRQHQVNAIWRALVTRKSLNAHEVGTGKTFTMGGIAVESRRYGIAKKPMLFAHNANSKSVAHEIQMMYPGAKVLYIDNLSKENVKTRMRQIANDDWDVVVLPHSLIDRIGFKEETLMAMAKEEISDLMIAAEEAAQEDNVTITEAMWDDEEELKKLRSATAKQLVKQRQQIIATIQKLAQRASQEGSIPFEDMGVDMLMVDEAHEFKKPPIATKMKMKGLQTQTSNRSIAMMFLTRYVRNMNNGGNVHLFTGTPITNTMTEVFHMMRYMMQEEMSDAALADWDGWFGSFAREVEDVELNPAGEYEAVTRLQAFINVPELRRMIGQYMDVVFAEDMPEMQLRKVDGKRLTDKDITEAQRAEILNGRTIDAADRPYKKVVNENSDMTPQQQVVFQQVQQWASRWRQMSKKDRKNAMIAGAPESPIIHEGIAAKASFDVRLVDAIANAGREGTPEMEPHPQSKPARVLANLLEIYRSDPNANQVVFMEQGMAQTVTRREGPTGAKKDVSYKAFSTVKDMIERLVQAGIPRDQIALVDGSTSKDRRKEVADAMNSGKIRIVFGSTDSLGVGVNMQRNLRAMHHMDAPWMPGELEQRNGRGHRQGNQWNTVMEYRYLTDRLDGRRWQVLAIKQRFITDFMKSKGEARVIEGDAASDDGGDILSTFSEAAGDPRILLKEKFKKKLENLQSRERMHAQAQADAIGQVQRSERAAAASERRLADLREGGVLAKLAKVVTSTAGDLFQITIDGQTYDERAAANTALAAWLEKNVRIGDSREIGEFGGEPLYVDWARLKSKPDLVMRFGKDVNVFAQGTIGSLETNLRNRNKDIEPALRESIKESLDKAAHARTVADEPFHMAKELADAKKRLADLEADLERNPVAAPYWLRAGAPADTEVFRNGNPYIVTGHRWSDEGWFVLAKDDRGEVAIPYMEATDAQNMPLYEEREFEAPTVKTKDDQSKASRAKRGAGRGVPVAELTKLAQAMGGNIKVAATQADLPESASRFRSEISTGVRGAFIPKTGEIYLVAENLQNMAEAAFVSLHEGAHRGLRKLFGDDLKPVLNRIWMGNKNVRTKTAQYMAQYNIDKMEAIEEVLADMAMEGTTKDLTGWEMLVEFIRTWVRKFGDMIGAHLEITDDMVESIVGAAARKGLETEVREIDPFGLAEFGVSSVDEISPAYRTPENWRKVSAKMRDLDAARGLRRQLAGLEKRLNEEAGNTGGPEAVSLSLDANGNINVARLNVVGTGQYDALKSVSEFADANDLGVVVRRSAGNRVTYLDQLGYKRFGPSIRQAATNFKDPLLKNHNPVEWVREIRGAPLFSKMAPDFYSELAKQVAGHRLEAAPAGQWKATIKNMPGVKPDEIQWSGINEWLDMQQGKVSRQAVLDYLREGGVRVETTVLGGEAPYFHEESGDFFGGEDNPNPPKFAQWKLPGGDEYREVLMTLPKMTDVQIGESARKQGYSAVKAEDDRWDIIGPDGLGIGSGRGGSASEALASWASVARAKVQGRQHFRSTHWDQPDVVAHFRADVVAGADGKRYLRAFEFQSDWGQQGKKNGFYGPDEDVWTAKRVGNWVPGDDSLGKWLVTRNGQEAGWFKGNSEAEVISEAKGRNLNLRNGVPRGPFVGKTEAWLSLAIKRAIRMAADEGLDGVVFANGGQMADLFDLSKQVDKIDYYTRSGQTMVAIFPIDESPINLVVVDGVVGNAVKTPSQFVGKKLDEVVGKDVADKILNDPNDGTITGNGLRMGGEGMRAFYDKIVPNVANDVLRKLGGGKVGPITIEREPTGQDNPESTPITDDGMVPEKQLGFPITDALRERALAGMPLFSRLSDQLKGMNKSAGTDLFKGAPELDGGGQSAKVDAVARHTAEVAQREILADIADGTVPGTVKAFSELHDYVDANMYVSDADREDRRIGPLGKSLKWDMQEFINFTNRVIEATDAWLKADRKGDIADYLNDAPLASRGPGTTVEHALDALRSVHTPRQALNTVGELLQSTERFNVWNRTVGTQFQKAHQDADFGRVFDAVNAQITDTSRYSIEAEQLAPNILQRLETVKDVGKALFQGRKKHREDMKAVAQAVFDGIEGQQGVQSKVFTDAELRQQFNLTDRQIELYREFRRSVDTSLDRLTQSTAMKIAEKYLPVRRYAGLPLGFTMRSLEQRMQNLMQTLPPGDDRAAVADALNRILDLEQMNEDLKAKGYAPAMRFGRYAVSVGSDPQALEVFSMYETQTEANLAAMALRKQFPNEPVTQSVLNDEAWKEFAGVSPETVELFAKFTGATQSAAYKQYIELARSSRSAMKRMLDRKGIAGFSIDASRVLAQFVTSNARQASMNVHGGEITDALASPTLHRKGDVHKEAQHLAEYIRNPTEEAQSLRGLLFMHFMGGSLASAAVNMTQPVLMTTPYLSQFIGAKDLAGIMGRAAKAATTGKVSDPGMRNALARAAADGVTQPHEIHQLMAEAQGSAFGTGLRGRAFAKAWGGFFSLSEAWNRKLTFMAAFEVAQKTGHASPYRFAVNAVEETQGIYNKANRPNWARGPIGATLFTFKQFSIAYLEFLSRLPRKQMVIALAMLMVAAGLEGMPFADDIEDLIDTIGQRLGYATNSKKWLRKKIGSVLGDGMTEFVLHGFSALPGFPIDVAGRMGMSNLLPGTALFNPSRQDKAREVLEVFGAAGGFAKGLMEAADSKRISDALPVAVKNAVQAYKMWSTGEYRDSKGRLVKKVDKVDAAAKFLGFQPQGLAEDTRLRTMEMRDIDIIKKVESDITGDWARGIIEKDPQVVEDAKKRLIEWNRENPNLPIRIGAPQIARRVKEAMLTSDQRFIKMAPPEVRANVIRTLTA